MFRIFTFSLLIILLISFNVSAQHAELFNVPFTKEGRILPFALAGGMGAPQFSKVDLNFDGFQDIYVFDRISNISTAFINNGDNTYRVDNTVLANFPRMVEWVVMTDFDGDGIADLFTYSIQTTSGIRVFKGLNEGGLLSFDQFTWGDQLPVKNDVLHVHNRVNYNKTANEIYVFNVDIPAFYDVDGDGDLDILTFEQGGFMVHYYKNMSQELGFGLDSLIYILEDDCFGRFWESGVTPDLDLSDNPEVCNRPGNYYDDFDEFRDLRHAGSTVTALDINGNGLTDIILGDISFNELVLAINGGTVERAWMNDQDVLFPSYDRSVQLDFFPAAFHLDVDGDGLKDLLISVNDKNAWDDVDIVWFYKNVGTDGQSVFQFQQEDFLVGDMVDLGRGANPAFFDYNGDGLLDIVVGVEQRYLGDLIFESRLVLFENTGTAELPAFTLVDDDYLNFSQFPASQGYFDFSPHFADLDGDGDIDLLVGDYSGHLYYVENLSGPGQAAQFGGIQFGWQDIRTETNLVPLVYDLDEDGLPDLILGDRRGELRFYKNIGTESQPLFNPNINELPNKRRLGDITVRGPSSFLGTSAPTIVYDEGVKKFIIGSNTEGLHVYDIVITDDPFAPFQRNLLDETAQLKNGNKTRPAFADITNDGFLEMLVGNIRGGFTLYKTRYRSTPDLTSSTSSHPIAMDWVVSPNPVSDNLFIQLSISQADVVLGKSAVAVYNTIGQMIHKSVLTGDALELSTSSWHPGIYFIEWRINGQGSVKKVIKR